MTANMIEMAGTAAGVVLAVATLRCLRALVDRWFDGATNREIEP